MLALLFKVIPWIWNTLIVTSTPSSPSAPSNASSLSAPSDSSTSSAASCPSFPSDPPSIPSPPLASSLPSPPLAPSNAYSEYQAVGFWLELKSAVQYARFSHFVYEQQVNHYFPPLLPPYSECQAVTVWVELKSDEQCTAFYHFIVEQQVSYFPPSPPPPSEEDQDTIAFTAPQASNFESSSGSLDEDVDDSCLPLSPSCTSDRVDFEDSGYASCHATDEDDLEFDWGFPVEDPFAPNYEERSLVKEFLASEPLEMTNIGDLARDDSKARVPKLMTVSELLASTQEYPEDSEDSEDWEDHDEASDVDVGRHWSSLFPTSATEATSHVTPSAADFPSSYSTPLLPPPHDHLAFPFIPSDSTGSNSDLHLSSSSLISSLYFPSPPRRQLDFCPTASDMLADSSFLHQSRAVSYSFMSDSIGCS